MSAAVRRDMTFSPPTAVAYLSTLTLAAVLSGCAGADGTDEPTQSVADGVSKSQDIFAGVRGATSKYHDESNALAAGYYPMGDCLEAPGFGAMGVHYINFDQAFSPIDPLKPAAVLYIPSADGPRLVAVEYIQFIYQDGQPYTGAAPPRADSIPPTPSVFGSKFDGPMPGHFPGMPWHFDHHVWIWAHNPSGMFAEFNPSVSCPH